MANNCDPHELCGECPEWIFTLADLLMCMMGLFVILWVLKPDASGDPEAMTMEEIRRQEVLRDIQVAFGASMEEQTEVELRLEELLRKLEQIKRSGAGEKGNASAAPRGADGTDPEVTRIREGDFAGVGGRVNFAAGDTTLPEEQKRSLEQVADKIRGYRNIVLVKGHTSPDDLPEGASVEEHMTLSLERAQRTARFLVEAGVSPDILRVQGCGGFEPVRLRAYTEAERRLNRRVEVVATDQLVQSLSDMPSLSPAPTPGAPATPATQPSDGE